MILDVQQCSLSFGGIKALTDISFSLEENQILGIIGPNGAGKTTLFNILTGVYTPDEGEILLEEKSIRGIPTYRINQRGIARTFQNIRLFQNLSVSENVQIAYHHRVPYSLAQAIFQTSNFLKAEAILENESHKLLQLFKLDHRSQEMAKNLSYGEQRKLEILRALATSPKILLLDEPAAGMNRNEKEELMGLIRDIQKSYRMSIIIIEHDMSVVMQLCSQSKIIVLDYGEKIAEGPPEKIQNDPRVIEAYLGKKEEKGHHAA